MKKRYLYMSILLVFLILAILINTPYREFIYKYNINDYGIADAGGKIFIVSIFSIMSWLGLFKLTDNKVMDVLLISLVYFAMEIISLFFPFFGTFDSKDLIALILGTFIAITMAYFLEKNSFKEFTTNYLVWKKEDTS